MQKVKSGYDDSNDRPAAREHGNTPGDGNSGEHRPGGDGKCRGQQDKQAQYNSPHPVIKGLVFDYMGKQTPDRFIKGMEGIHSYVGTNYKKYTTDFSNALGDLELNDPDEPTPPDPGNHELEQWKVRYR